MYFDSIYLWKESILFFKNKVWRGVTHARAAGFSLTRLMHPW
jgi:hypothetical protein